MDKPAVTPGGKAFRDIVVAGTPVVWDGAMGTMLYEQGVLTTRAFEECNITQAEKVKAVHVSFIAAGAQVIQTNTFGANRFSLGRFGVVNVVEVQT
ncbi:Homocysteine S-methyltransferase [Baffinella frigidus]|nr:Homocysteine S-methyltransferase [Cryptophyta sp. CCMP2293]